MTPEEFDRLIKAHGLITLEETSPEERERWVEERIEARKKQNEGYGPPLFEEDLERMRAFLRRWAPRWRQPIGPRTAVFRGERRPSPEKMHEEVLAAGWTCEAKKSFRRANGRVYEADFYWSPTRKIGAFLYSAWRTAKNGNMRWGETV